jgi:hypothetical protein
MDQCRRNGLQDQPGCRQYGKLAPTPIISLEPMGEGACNVDVLVWRKAAGIVHGHGDPGVLEIGAEFRYRRREQDLVSSIIR